MASERILIVDHESKLLHLLRQILTNAHFGVIAAQKGEQALQLAAEEAPVLMLTAIHLPGGMDGVEFTRRVRQFSDAPVILMVSDEQVEEILRGFEAGADGYVSVPFDPRLLVAKIKALIKRSQGRPADPVVLSFGGLEINLAAQQVTQNGVEIYLTETEYKLLLELARHRDQVMLHEQLLMAVWGPKYCGELDYLRSYIHILRRKLEPVPSQPKLIISRPGIGYMLVSSSGGLSDN